MQAQECLEDNMDDGDFSAECKEELESVIAKASVWHQSCDRGAHIAVAHSSA